MRSLTLRAGSRCGWLVVAALIALSASARSIAAGPATEATTRLLDAVEPRIRAIEETDEFHVRSFDATWLPDGSGYLKLETPAGAAAPEVARYDAATGARTVLAGGEKLVAPGTTERLRIHGFTCSPPGRSLLLHTDTVAGSDHWLYEPATGTLRPVTAGDGVGFGENAFSPDERRLLGSRGGNLFVYDI
ncbi:MAG: hypothetical protein ACKOOF_04860, partial [Planctomycetaceae bacterium]